MVGQRVTGTEWCIQMSVMICFELPVPENCDLCCCYTSLCMVSSQASLGIVYTMSTDIWAALCAEAARAVCWVSMLCECVTPLLGRSKHELCVTGSHLPEPLLYWGHWGGGHSVSVQHQQNQDKFVSPGWTHSDSCTAPWLFPLSGAGKRLSVSSLFVYENEECISGGS